MTEPPRTEPAEAGRIVAGDVLVIDGREATVTDVRFGDYWLDSGHAPGIAVGWRAGSSSGVMFRRVGDLLDRVAP